MNEVSDTELYNELAEKYKVNKRNALTNILDAGRILQEAKERLSHGQFSEWLADHRVNESIRTAQRLMSIFRNYGHILETDKIESLSEIGISALLELQKLPDRFKKEIEVVVMTDEGEKRELREVFDEDKLAGFLNEAITTDEGVRLIKDLSLSEMRKCINNAAGIYEPEDDDVPTDDGNTEVVVVDAVNPPLLKDANIVGKGLDTMGDLLTTLSHISSSCFEAAKKLELVCDESFVSTMSDKDKESFNGVSKRLRSDIEALHVKLDAIEV